MSDYTVEELVELAQSYDRAANNDQWDGPIDYRYVAFTARKHARGVYHRSKEN